ncbi:hypothetical protein CIW83_18175 [Tissierella sp. P1]|uniref:hypothetical protein n=1 Tax=Tissierella sp. P1 TaxID=1280483 RepID=UPI000BA01C67|nr:hypothetical protein [Tissierella sp. P1]OZV10851.1 hypothetical protein CIW83_18175 [Tissierella sp. P1]
MGKQQKINQKAKYYIEKLGIPIIPVCLHNHEGVYDDHKIKCKNPGKVLLIKNWTQKGVTILEGFDE